ncbi:MAG: NAD(P)/FAD-dependent oxidoreductase [Patescibacteria group bacterium UBA2163]
MKGVKQTYDVIVIGGGAAGMMAAAIAGARGKRVLLLEKNKKLGEKLRITGGGRCNILNTEADTRKLLSHFGDAAKFLFSPFSQFGVKETRAFFESHGLEIKEEANNRAFPVSENAEDVCIFFERLLHEYKVDVRTNMPITEMVKRGEKIEYIIAGNETFKAEAYILATGGVSHPETGSNGDGFTWLAQLGHEVLPPKPTIVPLRVEETWIRDLSGTTLPDTKITFALQNERKFSVRGNILVTHFGLSGPIILNNAAKVDDLLHEGVVSAYIDLFPDLDDGAFDALLRQTFDTHKNKAIRNACKEILPPGTGNILASRFPGIDPETPVHSVTKEQRKNLVVFLKNIPLTISGLMGMERAVVADGGVSLSEIDTKTMRSLVCRNLFVVGDLLNITRPSGGYSLQLCWTTGYVAGSSV